MKNRPRVYMTHRNYDRPFRVEVDDDRVLVQSTTREQDRVRITCRRVFVGRSPLNSMTRASRGYGPDFTGNCILLELGNKKYMFIGHKVYTFAAEAPIVRFVAPVGNNDLPYSYATDKEGNQYLFTEDLFLPAFDDPYALVYYMTNKKPIKVLRKFF